MREEKRWIAEDGTEFTNRGECIKYESKVKAPVAIAEIDWSPVIKMAVGGY